MWHGIIGHDDVVEQFRRALRRGRLATSFLFVGPAGIGKRTFALKLAQGLLCQTRPEAALDPCETCPSCVQAAAGTHPDLLTVAKPPDKSFLPLELLIGDDEHRMREGLVHDIGLKPFMGGRRIAIIDDADYLRHEGANCLLKTLEEPPPRSVLVLVGTSPARQLPTIRSRCQWVRFRPLAEQTVAELLVSRGLVADPQEARRLAAFSEGSLQRAMDLADGELWAFRGHLCERLAAPRLDSVNLAAAIQKLVESAGKDAAPRRERLRQIASLAAGFYRRLLRGAAGTPLADDAEVDRLVERAADAWQGRAEEAAACLDRCLEAAEQVDRNANQSTLVECWMDDLAGLYAAARPD